MLSAHRARQLFALHRWTGLLSGLFILFLSVTGAALVFITEIDRFVHAGLLVSQSRGPMIAPERAIAAAQQKYPAAEINRVDLPLHESGVYTLWSARVRADGREFNQIMVDPHTGRVTGVRMLNRSLPFVLRQLHLRFYKFGWQGRVVVGGFGLVLLFSTLTGLLIYGRFIRALPHWWSIRRERGFQISTSDWHKLVGILALAFNLVIAVTGAVLGLENLARYAPAVSQAIHPRPARQLTPEPPASLEGTVPVSYAIAQARAAVPRLRPLYVNLPRAKKRHYTVFGNMDGRIEMEGASQVGVHALTGAVYMRHLTPDMAGTARVYNWMDPLHFGYWGGVASKIFYLIFGLTTAFLSISGFIVWYMKKRRRRARPVALKVAA
jgi:uncharacterized iron-regulated membrane protein